MVGADHVVRVDGAVKAAEAHLHEAVHQLVASLGNARQRDLERLSRPAQRRAEDVVELDARLAQVEPGLGRLATPQLREGRVGVSLPAVAHVELGLPVAHES